MAKSGKLKRSKFSKTFGKVMSVMLCAALMVTTYTGFFAGFGAAAGAIEELQPGEVGLDKKVVQQDDMAFVTVRTGAKAFSEEITETSVVKQKLDVIIIIDTSGSMSSTSEGKTIMESVKNAAKDLAASIYDLNSENRVGLVSFAQYGYAYSPNTTSKIAYTSMTAGTNYWFTSSQKSTLNSRITNLSATGGTNSEGGLLAAKRIIDYTNDDRNKLVVFMTDGLPTGRYKDNGSKADSVTTYDGSGSGIPSYDELVEMLSVAEGIDSLEKAQLATVFYSGGLTDSYEKTNGMSTSGYTSYYPGCSSSSCRCNTANSNHGQVSLTSPENAQSESQKLMSGFYHKFDLGSANYIVNDLLQPFCEAGVYMPNNASEMLKAFKDIITSYTQKNFYAPATNAYYDEVIPEYLDVDEDSINVTTGKAVLLRDSSVEVNGKYVTRDVIRWTIGTIPEETQTLTYTLKVNDSRIYGIMDATMQGILRYNEVEGRTKTHSPLIVQIDELILAPKGDDDYFATAQDQILEGNILTNNSTKNVLVDMTGNADDASTIINGYAAGLNGSQSAVVLEGLVPVITDQPKWGTVSLNEDGSFTYTQNSDLYSRGVVSFDADPKANDAYNAVTSGWDDTFKYVITTKGAPTAVKAVSETPSAGAPVSTEPNDNSGFAPLSYTGINSVYNDKVNVLVFENMNQNGADSEGRIIVGGDFSCNGFSASQVDKYTDEYVMIVGGTVNYNNQWFNICNTSVPWNGGGDKFIASGEQWIKDYVASARNAYSQLSAYYATLPANGTTESGYSLVADPNHVAGTPHVFYIDGSKQFGQMFFKGTFGDDPIIVNISGKNVKVANGDVKPENSDLSTGKLAQQAVYNFYEADTLESTSISYQGSVLAPNATFTYSNGHVEGSVIVKNLEGIGSAQYNTGWQLYGVPVYFREGTGFGGQITSGGSAEASETETGSSLENYSVMSADVYNAQEALKSEEITVYIRIKPDFKNLSATKTSKPESGVSVKPGETITYTINVINPRAIPAEGVKVIDAVPAGTTLKDANGATVNGEKLEWILDVPARESKSVSFSVTVNDSVSGTNNLANVAYVEFTTPGIEAPSTINTNTVAHSYISAVKTSSVPAETVLDAGDSVTYTISLANNGSADAYDIAVSDKIPAGLTFAEGENVEFENGTVTATVASLKAGEKASVSFTCTVDQFNTGVQTYQNTAYVNEIATNTVENTAQRGSVTVSYIDKDTNEEIAKSVTEYGKTGSAYGAYEPVEVANYRHVSTTGSVTGTYTSENTEVVFLYERIPGTATVRFTDTEGRQLAVPVTVTGWQGDNIDTGYGKVDKIGHYSYQSTDATGSALTESGIVITHIYKLDVDTTLPTVIKSSEPADSATVAAGSYITYYIDITNNKYEGVNDVKVTDAIPVGTSLVDPNGAVQNGDSLEWVIPYIESGATSRVSFTVQVNSDNKQDGCLANTAHVSYTERESTVATELDSNTVTHGLLTFEKYTSDNPRGFYGVGDAITYFIKVRNIGTVAATAEISDQIPAGTTLCTGSPDVTIKLEPGAEQIVSFTVKVSNIEGFEAEINNTAYVNGVPTNTTRDIVKKASLTVRYQDEEGNELSGADHYTGTPGDEHPSTMPITIPGYTYARTEGTTDGHYADGTNLEIINIYTKTPASANILYMNKDTGTELLPRETITGYVGDELTDVLYKDIDNYQFIETDLSDGTTLNENGVTVIHYYRFIKPDDTLPKLAKTSVPAAGSYVKPGQEITYTITFNNTRIDPINEVVITDVIPAGCELLGASEGAGYDGNRIVWNIGTVEAGAKAEVSFTVKADEILAGSGNLGNVAKAVYSNRDFDPEDGVTSNKVGFPVILAELDHYNSQPKAVLTHGDDITYVVTVRNVGSADAVKVPVISYIPEGTTFKASDDFSFNGDGTVSAVLAKLVPGQEAELRFTVTVDQFATNVFTKDITNVAKVAGTDTNSVLDTPKTGAVIVEHIDYDGKSIKTETLTGLRLNTAYGPYSDLVTLKEIENRKLESVDKATAGKITEGVTVIKFTYGRIPAVLNIRYVETGTEPENEIREAQLITGEFWQGDAIPESYANGLDIDGYIYDGTDKPEVMTFVTDSATITNKYTRILDTDVPTLVKSSAPASGSLVNAGTEIQYTIELTNVRKTDALSGTVITDKVPAGTYYIEGSASDGGVYNKETGMITWTLGNVPAGETRKVSFGAKVFAHVSEPGLLGNTAHCVYSDVQVGETRTVDSNATSHALIINSKTSSVAHDTVLTEGSRIVYRVKATNYGTAPAPVVITDTIPDGLIVELSKLPENVVCEDDTLSLSVESLAPGATAELVFEAVVSMGGKYGMNITNTATVNEETTPNVNNIARRGEVEVSYEYKAPDGKRTPLEGGERVKGAVGDKVELAPMNSYENLRYLTTEASDEYEVFAEGLVRVVHVFESIPTKATILYKDIDTDRELLAGKKIDLYAGDKLSETYTESVENYEYVSCDAPKDLTVGANGLTITHYYKEIPDVTELVRVKSSVPAENTAVMAGDTIEYTITVTNPRREEINNVTVTDTVPAGTTLLDKGTAEVSGQTLKWVVSNLQPQEVAQFTFKVTVNSSFDPEAENLSNRADVIYTNRTEETETVLHTNTVRHAVITAEKAVDKTEANTMADLVYTITVRNDGLVDAENVTVTDEVPEGTEVTELPEGADLADGVVTYVIDKLAAGESKEISFTVNAGILAEGEYRKTIANKAKVNGVDTNTVETVIKQGEVDITYIDEDGNELRMPERLTGIVGDELKVAPAEIEGYELTKTEGDAEGEFIEGQRAVRFTYKRMANVVKVTYVDIETNEPIASPVIIAPEEDEEAEVIEEVKYQNFTGYTHESSDIPEEIEVTDKGLDIVHYYAPVAKAFRVTGKVDVSRKAVESETEEVSEGETAATAEENGAEDVYVTLFDKNEVEVDTVVTDNDGGFVFEEVPAGSYTVRVENTDKYEAEQKEIPLTVVEDTSVRMKMFKTKVLGASDQMVSSGSPAQKTTDQIIDSVETVKVFDTVEITETNNATYSKVLGDSDAPSTGDNDFATGVALVIAAAALFVLILTSKHS